MQEALQQEIPQEEELNTNETNEEVVSEENSEQSMETINEELKGALNTSIEDEAKARGGEENLIKSLMEKTNFVLNPIIKKALKTAKQEDSPERTIALQGLVKEMILEKYPDEYEAYKNNRQELAA